jgi:hypothetical protein
MGSDAAPMRSRGFPEVFCQLPHGREARVLGDPVIDFDERWLRDLGLLGQRFHV